MIIDSGVGNGASAGVTLENQLQVVSESHALQHHKSVVDGEAYQVIGDFAAVNNNTHTILHLKNDNAELACVITYIRVAAVGLAGGTTLPNAADYFQLGFGTTYSSGGTAVTPVNLNTGSGRTSSVTSYDNNATVTGTFTEIDRWYIEANGKEERYNKEASVIIQPGDTFEVRVVSTHTSGTAIARVSFVMTND